MARYGRFREAWLKAKSIMKEENWKNLPDCGRLTQHTDIVPADLAGCDTGQRDGYIGTKVYDEIRALVMSIGNKTLQMQVKTIAVRIRIAGYFRAKRLDLGTHDLGSIHRVGFAVVVLDRFGSSTPSLSSKQPSPCVTLNGEFEGFVIVCDESSFNSSCPELIFSFLIKVLYGV